jgi:hypothetical protein
MYVVSTRSVACARLEGEAATARAAMLRDASQRRAAMLLGMRGSGVQCSSVRGGRCDVYEPRSGWLCAALAGASFLVMVLMCLAAIPLTAGLTKAPSLTP